MSLSSCTLYVKSGLEFRSMGGHPETLETNVLVYDKDADEEAY